MQAGPQERQRGQLRQVLTDADGLGVELKQFHLLGVGGGAQDEAEGSRFSGGALVLIEPSQVELYLSDVGRVARLEFQFDGDQATQWRWKNSRSR
jgi:hypothetical protein